MFEDKSGKRRETSRQLAEISLVQDHAPIAMILVAPDGRICNVNAFAGTLFDWSVEKMLGMPIGRAMRCVHYLDDPQDCGFGTLCGSCPVREAINKTFAPGGSGSEIEAWITRDGQDAQQQICLQISTALLDVGGASRALVCCQDITRRKQTEDELRESEEKFRLTFNFSPDAVNVNRMHDGLYVDINEGFTRLTGYSRGDVIGRSSLDIDIWEDVADRRRLVNDLQAKGYCENLEARFRRKDGSVTTALMSARIISLKNEAHIISITRDISERMETEATQRKLEQQLHQAQRMESVGRLAGGIAHDFNNLLSVILGYSEMVLEDGQEHQDHLEPVRQIQEAALRARDLTRQLLAYSRKQLLEFRVVDLCTVVTRFQRMLGRVLGEDIRLALEVADRPLWIRADAAQVEQVLMNLAVNARDAMPNGGTLTLSTAAVNLDHVAVTSRPGVQPGEYALIKVSDSGCGMDEETLSRIFDPFFTTKDPEQGTGLGLATSYGIVKQHSGSIWVESAVGVGTVFFILLPLSAPEVEGDPSKDGIAMAATTSGTILVVEDDRTVRQLAARMLEKRGYTVIQTVSVEDALAQAATVAQVDLILCDVIMPAMSGPEVVGHIAKYHPRAKVLYMSGYTGGLIARHGVLEEGMHFLQKPFSMGSLLGKVGFLLGN